MHKPSIDSAEYLYRALDPLQIEETIARARIALEGVDFDAIAFTGLSGALIAPIIAREMRKTMLAVRKLTCDDDFHCHSSRKVEGDIAARRYVIIDDIVSTGATIGNIISAVKAAQLNSSPSHVPAECVGVFEYYFSDRRRVKALKDFADYQRKMWEKL